MMFSPGDEAAARPTVLRFLASDGLALALETRGVGSRRVLFAHGFGHARGIFEDVAAALDPTLYTVGRLDGRGAGRSDRAQTYDLAAFTRDLVTALESADGPTDLVAHGLAARAALEVASRPPRWLARLVLVCPVLRLDPAALASAAASCGSRIAIARELRRLASVELRPDLIERLVDEAVGIDRAASAAWLALGDGSPAAEPTVPTLVVTGAHDRFAHPGDDGTSVVVAGARVVELAAGHLVPVEVPRELASVLASRAEPQRAGCDGVAR